MKFWLQLRIVVLVLTRKTWKRFSTLSSRQNQMGWEWDYRFAARSSNRMGDAFGLYPAIPG